MITAERYKEIDKEIKTSIEKIFNTLKNNSLEKFILYLANADFIENNTKNRLPYVLNYKRGMYRDKDRILFLTDFLNTHYSFKNSHVDDNKNRLTLELMIYTHIWESKFYLKKLYRLAHLLNTGEYKWNCDITNTTSKYDFISKKIKKPIKNKGVELGEIIEKGYHSSLRNAFAHSDYSFDTSNGNKRIILHNYTGKIWELKSISFDEWSERFSYSALLCYNLLKMSIEIEKIMTPLETKEFTVKIPTYPEREVIIIYDEVNNELKYKTP